MTKFNPEDEDALARMLDPEGQARRASEAERAEHERAQADALRQQRRAKFKMPAAIVGGILATALVVVGGNALVKKTDKDSAEAFRIAQINYATDPAFLAVEGLRAHGACAAELNASSKLEAARAKDFAKVNTKEETQGLLSTSMRLRAAAGLAMKYHVSCTPAQAGPTYSLTPNFEVPYMRENRICEDELRSVAPADPSTQPNELQKAEALFAAHHNQIAADLAASQDIPC